VDLLMLIECVCCDGRTINEDCGREYGEGYVLLLGR
jgi:hypothetical protein